MKVRVYPALVAALMLSLTLPMWAKRLTAEIDLDKPARLGTVQLAPGHYQLVADEQTGVVRVLRNGRTVAEVKGEWFKMDRKPSYTETLMTQDTIQEIHFAGRLQGIRFTGGQTAESTTGSTLGR
jgi:hypothetical protein